MYVAMKDGVVVFIQKDNLLLPDMDYDTVKKFPDGFNNNGIGFDVGWDFDKFAKDGLQCFFPPHPSMVPPPDQLHQVFVEGPDGKPMLVENPD